MLPIALVWTLYWPPESTGTFSCYNPVRPLDGATAELFAQRSNMQSSSVTIRQTSDDVYTQLTTSSCYLLHNYYFFTEHSWSILLLLTFAISSPVSTPGYNLRPSARGSTRTMAAAAHHPPLRVITHPWPALISPRFSPSGHGNFPQPCPVCCCDGAVRMPERDRPL